MEEIGFLHVGKTGGTSIKDVLKDQVGDGFYYHGHGGKLSRIWKNHPQRRMVFGYREPVSRFISGFNSRMRKGRPRYNVEWSKLERIAFENFKQPVELAEALGSNDKKVRSLAEMCMCSIQHVNKSLYEYLGSEDFLLKNSDNILYPYNVDTLHDDFDVIKFRLGIPQHIQLSSDEKNHS